MDILHFDISVRTLRAMRRTLPVHSAPRVFLFFSVFSVLVHTGQSQTLRDGRRDVPGVSDESQLVYYKAFNLPAADSTKSRVDIHFRVSHNFFVFVRNERGSASDDSLAEFVARADITVELLDQSGSSVARELMQKNIGTSQPERTVHRDEFLQGIFSFTLPPGGYTIVVQIDDLESSRQYLDKSKTVTLRDFKKNPFEVSDVLFIEPLASAGHEISVFVPVNLGGDVFFGRNFDAYVEIDRNIRTVAVPELSYFLYRLEELSGDTIFYVRDSLVHNRIAAAKELDIERKEAAYQYRLRPSGGSDRLAAIVQLNGDQLEQGKYEIRILVSDRQYAQSVVHPFRVRWINMPRSLYNPDLAIDALEYIASPEELAGLKSMFTKRRGERFAEFWKKRDPTPQTAFNEAMAEYYRRVDYAMENLSTLRTPLAYKTDRGKVHILYGHPSRAERKFSPTAPPMEIWEYDSAKKRFIFVDADRQGNYKLRTTENLQ